jgi:hypothetical protein
MGALDLVIGELPFSAAEHYFALSVPHRPGLKLGSTPVGG